MNARGRRYDKPNLVVVVQWRAGWGLKLRASPWGLESSLVALPRTAGVKPHRSLIWTGSHDTVCCVCSLFVLIKGVAGPLRDQTRQTISRKQVH